MGSFRVQVVVMSFIDNFQNVPQNLFWTTCRPWPHETGITLDPCHQSQPTGIFNNRTTLPVVSPQRIQ